MSPDQPAPPAPMCPSVAVLDKVTGLADPVLRNLQITQAYHELSGALRCLTGPSADWCTFATWASRQAGQTIRGEDLKRTIQAEFAGLPHLGTEAVGEAFSHVRDALRALGRPLDDLVIAGAIRELFSPEALIQRCSEAVARGNRKVFDEIGRGFACFIPLAQAAAGAREFASAAEEVCGGFRPGAPPDGQQLLQAAFRDYGRALSTSDRKARAELMLLANLRIGLHEQTRLQPDIADALNVAIPEPGELTHALLRRLPSDQGFLHGIRDNLERLEASLGIKSGVDRALSRLVEHLRHRVRMLITEEMMSIALPDDQLKLGADVTGMFPDDLRHPTDPELIALLADVDPTPDTLRGSGVQDWAVLAERMRFITDLFRTRQEDLSLFQPPFTPSQIESIRQGRLPSGSL